MGTNVTIRKQCMNNTIIYITVPVRSKIIKVYEKEVTILCYSKFYSAHFSSQQSKSYIICNILGVILCI